jgi:hypothetical protein
MLCPRCNSPMIVMERSIQPHSTQTWFQCTVCSGQRLLSAETACSSSTPLQPLGPLSGADPGTASEGRPALHRPRQLA